MPNRTEFRPAARSARRQDRGFALLIVLWTVALLALLTSGLTASGRGEVKLAENLRDAALAEAAADGAVQEAIFRLTAGQWMPGLVQHQTRIGNAVTTVRIEDEAGLVNPNQAPATLLAALLREVGADPQTAQTLAREIEAFHNSGASDPAPYIAAGLPYGPGMRDFHDVAELRLLPGVTPVLYARLAPHLSVWTWPPLVPAAADPIVLAAFRDAGPDEDAPPTPSLQRPGRVDNRLSARITAVSSAGGARFTRIADVQVFGQTGGPPRPPSYQIMSWTSPED